MAIFEKQRILKQYSSTPNTPTFETGESAREGPRPENDIEKVPAGRLRGWHLPSRFAAEGEAGGFPSTPQGEEHPSPVDLWRFSELSPNAAIRAELGSPDPSNPWKFQRSAEERPPTMLGPVTDADSASWLSQSPTAKAPSLDYIIFVTVARVSFLSSPYLVLAATRSHPRTTPTPTPTLRPPRSLARHPLSRSPHPNPDSNSHPLTPTSHTTATARTSTPTPRRGATRASSTRGAPSACARGTRAASPAASPCCTRRKLTERLRRVQFERAVAAAAGPREASLGSAAGLGIRERWVLASDAVTWVSVPLGAAAVAGGGGGGGGGGCTERGDGGCVGDGGGGGGLRWRAWRFGAEMWKVCEQAGETAFPHGIWGPCALKDVDMDDVGVFFGGRSLASCISTPCSSNGTPYD
ncbi:hypothetical protein DL765_002324 [Monosporascus sp. GIB2]|nr:hypothetical protein DL765_002324 [Monosporascus sp. GIB2]